MNGRFSSILSSIFHPLSKKAALILLAMVILVGCTKEEEPQGPAGALGKTFNLVLEEISNTLVKSVIVSPDGSKILVEAYSDNYQWYSTDAGTSFTKLENVFLTKTVAIDNQGNFLLNDGRVYRNNSFTTMNTPGNIFLGDNGKVFSYEVNTGKVYYKNITDATATEAVMPITPTPGSGASTYHALKAQGRGFLFIDASGADTRTIKTFLLDEATLQWSQKTFSLSKASINSCSNPSVFERYVFLGNNTIALTGCSAMALLNISTGVVTPINYPTIEGLPFIGEPLLDNKGQIYLVAGNYGDLSNRKVHVYNGTTWTATNDVMMTSVSGTFVLTADANNMLYFNTPSNAGQSLTGFVKFNAQTGSKTPHNVPPSAAPILDAAAVNSNRLLIVAESKLVNYDIPNKKLSIFPIGEISHISILPDGRWLAGGKDRVLFSSDQGATWTEVKNIFTSINPAKAGFTVVKSRVVNGTLLLSGLYSYSYQNLSLGITQQKYDNIVVSLTGSTSAATTYQFPNDFLPGIIAPDGTIYGSATFVSEFGTVIDQYELKPNSTPLLLKTPGAGLTPMIITDDNLQMTLNNSKNGTGFEIYTRTSVNDEWKTANTVLPVPAGSYEGLKIIQSGNRIIFISRTEVYLSSE